VGLILVSGAEQAAIMDWKPFLTLALMLPASCSGRPAWDLGKPGTIVIDRIERALAGRPCIGALDRWERHYAFADGPPDMPVNRSVVYFSFVQAGVDGFRAQRRIEYLEDQPFYDGPARVALGEYRVADDRVFVRACGSGSEVARSILNSINAARNAR
jgi:hypothetical protein